MTKLTDTIPDIRFSFEHLTVAPTKALQEKLETVINENPSEFKEVNWITDSRAYNVSSLKNKKFENNNICKTLDENNELANCVKDVLKGILSKDIKLDEDLINYVMSETTTTSLNNDISDNNISNIPNNDSDNDNSDDDSNENNDFSNENSKTNINNENIYSSYFNSSNILNDELETFSSIKQPGDLTTYSIVPGRLISYHTICEMSKAISRQRLTLPKKDESIKFAEEREKVKLRQELEKYMKLNQINSDLQSCFNVDIEQMTLKQLQTYSSEARQMYEKLKIMDVILEGIDGVDKIQQTVFKDGIKIPGTKKAIKVNNVGVAVKSVLFDKNKPMYVAFGNLIDKYNLRVSDELLAAMTLISSIYKNVEIVDVADKKKNNDEDDEDDEDEEENNDESEDDEEEDNDDDKKDNDDDEDDDEK